MSVKAVIIAGGEGTRLRPLTKFLPKPLLPIIGKSMIDRQIDRLHEAGVDDIIINVGYKYESFERHFKKRSNVSLSREYTPMGTAGAVKLAESLYKDADAVVVLNADILTNVDIKKIIDYHLLSKSFATLFSVKVEDPSRFGLILADERTKDVSFFLEKIPKKEAENYTENFFINGGIYVMSPNALSFFPENTPLSFEKDVFPTLLIKGYPIKRFDFSGYWLDVGTKKTYLKAQADFLLGKCR